MSHKTCSLLCMITFVFVNIVLLIGFIRCIYPYSSYTILWMPWWPRSDHGLADLRWFEWHLNILFSMYLLADAGVYGEWIALKWMARDFTGHVNTGSDNDLVLYVNKPLPDLGWGAVSYSSLSITQLKIYSSSYPVVGQDLSRHKTSLGHTFNKWRWLPATHVCITQQKRKLYARLFRCILVYYCNYSKLTVDIFDT